MNDTVNLEASGITFGYYQYYGTTVDGANLAPVAIPKMLKLPRYEVCTVVQDFLNPHEY